MPWDLKLYSGFPCAPPSPFHGKHIIAWDQFRNPECARTPHPKDVENAVIYLCLFPVMNTDMGKSQPAPAPTLNSWKEIAVYLGRGVRTVQRWHSELRLPVHRVWNTPHSPVSAYTSELDEWLRRQLGGSNEAHIKHDEINGKLKQEIRANLARMHGLREELRETRRTQKKLVSELHQQRKALVRLSRRDRARR